MAVKRRVQSIILIVSASILLLAGGFFAYRHFMPDKPDDASSYEITDNGSEIEFNRKKNDGTIEITGRDNADLNQYGYDLPPGYTLEYRPYEKPQPTPEVTPEPVSYFDDFNEWDEQTNPEEEETLNETIEISENDGIMNVILDLDYSSDIDDVCAVRVATQADKEGYIHLRAVMSSTAGTNVTKAMHAQLSYDGYANVPIGISSGTTADGSVYWNAMISKYFNEQTFVTWPSVELYKQVLRENEKTRIITTGYVINIANLLKDPEGYELVKEKVDAIYITGGVWTSGSDYNFVHSQEAADAIRYVVANSPVIPTFSTYMTIQEGENFIMCGGNLMQKDTLQVDPISIAFRAYEQAYDVSLAAGRMAWDPMCVWAACLPAEQTQITPAPCFIWIGENGENSFTSSMNPNCYVLLRNSPEVGWYKNQLEMFLERGMAQNR